MHHKFGFWISSPWICVEISLWLLGRSGHSPGYPCSEHIILGVRLLHNTTLFPLCDLSSIRLYNFGSTNIAYNHIMPFSYSFTGLARESFLYSEVSPMWLATAGINTHRRVIWKHCQPTWHETKVLERTLMRLIVPVIRADIPRKSVDIIIFHAFPLPAWTLLSCFLNDLVSYMILSHRWYCFIDDVVS